MKILLLSLIASTALAASPGLSGRNTEQAAEAKAESPFACDRLALDPEARKRHFDELGPWLRDAIRGVHELSNGYEFQFSNDPVTIQRIAEWVAGERVCCPFFDFSMQIAREGGPLWLTLTGREGTKRFIEVDAAGWLKHARVNR